MTRKAGFEVIGPTLVAIEDGGEVVGGQPEMAVPQVPHPGVLGKEAANDGKQREGGRKRGQRDAQEAASCWKKDFATEARLADGQALRARRKSGSENGYTP